MAIEFFLARKYLSSQGGRGLSVITWIALAGVIVGVMSLVAVLAVMSGFDESLRSKILGNNAHIIMSVYPSEASDAQSFEAVLNEVKENKKVSSAMPVFYAEAFFLSPTGDSEGAFIKAVDPKEVKKVLDLDNYLLLKNWKEFETGGMFLGASLAKRLKLRPGDRFTMLINKADFSPVGIIPKMRREEVVDVFKSGMTQYDAQHAYISLAAGEKIFDRKPYQIEVRANDVRQIQNLREELQNHFEGRADVNDWISVNEDFLSALRLEKTAMAIILALIILVAAFNICGSLIMIVRDKTKDIAILKSMGTSDSKILKIFFFQGLFIGGVGTIVGLILGVILSLLLKDYIHFPLNPNVYMLDQVPVDIRMSDLLVVMLGAFFISSLATLYPAKLAASLNPTEGLKVD